jgi:hypothetical protein
VRHSLAAPNAVARNQAQVAPVLEEHVSSGLRWVDANAVVRDDGGCLGRDLELRSDSGGCGEREETSLLQVCCGVRTGSWWCGVPASGVVHALHVTCSSRRPKWWLTGV